MAFLPPIPPSNSTFCQAKYICPHPHRAQWEKRQSPIHHRKLSMPIVRMSGSRNQKVSHTAPLVMSEDTILPQGAFTLVLTVKLRANIAVGDAKALLSEYGRCTCAELAVLRCDVLYEVTKRGVMKGQYFHIWITFENSRAYIDHERTSHACKLRICLDNPNGGDNAVLLTKLSHSVALLRPVRPTATDWRSCLSSGVNDSVATSRSPLRSLSQALNSTLGVPRSSGVDGQRESLNRLVANVGLEDVKILISSATATNPDAMRLLRSLCEQYLADLEKSAGIVRTGLLIDRNDPFAVVLVSVHDADDSDGAFFDLQLAEDCISDPGWSVKRFGSVFPDKIGWEKHVDETEAVRLGLVEAPPNVLSATPVETGLMKRTVTPTGPTCRLLYGTSAFDNTKQYVRDLAGMQTGEVRVLFICGWNQARLHPLLVQLEYNRHTDPGRIVYKFGPVYYSCQVSAANIRKGITAIREFEPDIILGFGGGSVMDMAKLLSRFCNCSDAQLDHLLGKVDHAVDTSAPQLVLQMECKPKPLMLIPTFIGPGAELTDVCIIGGKTEKGPWRRLPLYFDDTNFLSTASQSSSKVVLVDSRMSAPRRILAEHTAPSAICNTCIGIDVLLSAVGVGMGSGGDGDGDERSSVTSWALQVVSLSFANVLLVRREPEYSPGGPRDALVKARTSLGLAADSVGHIGVCVRLALGVLDALVDGRWPFSFRNCLVRVAIAVIDELCADEYADLVGDTLRDVTRAMQVDGKSEIARQLLNRAEDCNMPLLRGVGMVSRTIPDIAQHVSSCLQQVECNDVEAVFRDCGRVERVLFKAISQEYEL